MKYALSDEERRRRRAETAAMTKCECGNVARHGSTMCGRCVEQASEGAQMRELLGIIRDTYTDPAYRFEATADALQLIWEKIS